MPHPLKKHTPLTHTPLYTHPFTSGLAVRFDDVSFHYPEQRPEAGLKHVGFEIRPGTTTALVGSTGACVFIACMVL